MADTSLVLDHYDDGGLLLRKLFADKGTPSIIKTAADMSNPATLNAEDYALVIGSEWGDNYKFPCVDAGNTLSSAIYFAEYGSTLPAEMQKEAAAKISAALESFGFDIPEDMTKVASADLGYELGSTNESEDAAFRKLFGFDESTAYEELEDEFAGMSPRGKRRLALQIKIAGVLDVAPPKVQAYAGNEFGGDVGFCLDMRKRMAPNADIGALKEKVASASVEDAADAIYEFDISNKLTAFYGRPLPDPYASVLGNAIGTTIEKNASGALEIDGRTYSSDSISSFATAGKAQLTDAFGDDFADQFSSDPVAVLGSLPVTHKKAIARMIDDTDS
jgi:hypothetical protein